MSVRIIDIAKEASVSLSAVSLALNNKPGVSEDVRKNIVAIAERLGYKSIVPDENMTIRLIQIAKHGHIINEWHRAFVNEYMEGIEIAAKKLNYKLEVSFFSKIPIEEVIAGIKEINVDGLIILGTELNNYELNGFTEIDKPILFIDTYFPLSIYDCVEIDNVDGAFRAIQYLYNSGHRKIGLVKSRYENWNFKMREYGFREAMEYFSLPVLEKFIASVDPTFDQSMVDMDKYLSKNKELPTAFFCMNDIISYGCMKALKNHNYKIPDDISVVGFDDMTSSSIFEPPLTTIKVSSHRIGQRALEKLVDRIKNPQEYIPENILISGKLIIRNSVKQLGGIHELMYQEDKINEI